MIKQNYNKKMFEIINSFTKKEDLLIHSCCGPCSTSSITQLSPFFNITVFFYNPNIDSLDEYNLRAKEQKRFINETKKEYNINYIEADYSSEDFYTKASLLKDSSEGGVRCNFCFNLRLEKTAKKAKSLNINWFTSTLTISPHKNAKTINKIGEKLANKYNLNWLFSDFKKNDGFKNSIILSKKHNLYRQNYCGCKWSKH